MEISSEDKLKLAYEVERKRLDNEPTEKEKQLIKAVGTEFEEYAKTKIVEEIVKTKNI